MIKAPQVLDALRRRWPSPAYAMLREVRNGVGFSRRQDRYADAVVVSCYPSRGLWIAGVEVKVDHADWRRELADPAKAAEIQKWCHHWWIAAPAGLIDIGDVPATWGLIEIEGTGRTARCVTRREAPRLDPQAADLVFLASVLRNASESAENAIAHAVSEATEDLRKELGDEAVRALQSKIRALETERSSMRERIAAVDRFERASGVAVSDRWSSDGKAARFKAVESLLSLLESGGRYRMDDLALAAERLQAAVSSINAAREVLAPLGVSPLQGTTNGLCS